VRVFGADEAYPISEVPLCTSEGRAAAHTRAAADAGAHARSWRRAWARCSLAGPVSCMTAMPTAARPRGKPLRCARPCSRPSASCWRAACNPYATTCTPCGARASPASRCACTAMRGATGTALCAGGSSRPRSSRSCGSLLRRPLRRWRAVYSLRGPACQRPSSRRPLVRVGCDMGLCAVGAGVPTCPVRRRVRVQDAGRAANGLPSGRGRRGRRMHHPLLAQRQGAAGLRMCHPIAALHPHALTGGLRAQQLARDGDLVLMDAGSEMFGYCSDVSRTWPVSGKFSAQQGDVYALVRDTHRWGPCLAATSAPRWARVSRLTM